MSRQQDGASQEPTPFPASCWGTQAWILRVQQLSWPELTDFIDFCGDFIDFCSITAAPGSCFLLKARAGGCGCQMDFPVPLGRAPGSHPGLPKTRRSTALRGLLCALSQLKLEAATKMESML